MSLNSSNVFNVDQVNLLRAVDPDNDHGADGMGPEAKRLKSK